MMVFYLETSALVKRYKAEVGSDAVDKLFDEKTQDEAFVTSLFTVLEVIAVAARLFRGHVLTQEEYRTLLRQFVADMRNLVILPVENALIIESIAIARDHSVKAGDAVQVASALQIKSAIQGTERLIMVASDRDIRMACPSLGLELLDPTSDNAMQRLKEFRQ